MDSSVRRFGRRPPFTKRPYVLNTRFYLPFKHFNLAWEAMGDFRTHSTSRSGLPSHRIVNIFNQAVEFGVGISRDNTNRSDNGDIVAIWYKGYGSLGKNHNRFFQRIAKYVQAGSYINLMMSDRPDYTDQCVQSGMDLEENITYAQWYFNGDCMVEKTGALTFK